MTQRHSIIPAPKRTVHISPMAPDVRGVISDTAVGVTHTIASAGAIVLFLVGVLTNL